MDNNEKIDYFVTEGYFNEENKFVIKSKLLKVDNEKIEELDKFLNDHLLKIEYTYKSSYDNSDDDRVEEDSHNEYDSTTYRKIEAKKDANHLLFVDGELQGVVFRTKPDRESVFFFDGREYHTLTLGYSASHSSCYSTIYKITLVKKGENGAPEKGGYINFTPYEKSADF
ncbi:MAG: hypothetical protein IKB42_00925 [Clostridia bacterium]|nr:hypothetical protein [Clostridia bacterium]